VINHDVVRLDVAVHDAPGVAEVEGLTRRGFSQGRNPSQTDIRALQSHLEELVDVITDIEISEFRVEDLEVGVVDVFRDDRGRLALQVQRDQLVARLHSYAQPTTTAHRRVSDNVEKGNDVGPAREVHEDLDLALDLLLLDGLEHLHDALG
jgi:hypothetical protein